MTSLTPQRSARAEHDVRSLGAVVVSAVVLVTLLIGGAGILGSVVDLAGWALSVS